MVDIISDIKTPNDSDPASDDQVASEYLSGKMLVAMPGMTDPRFTKTVIYMCAHNTEGAMGLVVNRSINTLTFPDLLGQLDIKLADSASGINIHFGGPVESGRGFVLHSPDYLQESSLLVDDGVALTATVDILRAIADGIGPKNRMLALGYAGWGAGQLDNEMIRNGWLHVDADDELVFGADDDQKWLNAIKKIGIDPLMLSDDAGHA